MSSCKLWHQRRSSETGLSTATERLKLHSCVSSISCSGLNLAAFANWTQALRRIIACLLLVCVLQPNLYGQAGLREALEKLDVNQNGMIEADEVTPLARPYLERIILGQSRRVSEPFRRPMRIDKIQESARIYYAIKNGVSGADVRPEGERMVKPFGLDPDQNYVPEFGLADVKFPYVQDDVDQAKSIMGRYDFNEDGYIDRDEAQYNRWTHRNPFDDDMNKDDRISRMELIQRYARRRLISGNSQELVRQAWRTGGDIESSDKPKSDNSQWWRQGGSSHWLAASMMGRFDSNRNGILETQEAMQMGIPIGKIDENGDGEVTRDELHILISELQDAAGDVTEGLPGWFFELDADRDGQVAMHEFSEEWSLAKREEFLSLDLNGDGLLTDTEVLRSASVVGGSYQQENAEILPPRRSVISEIEVEDDYLIKDLNVQISITHSNCSFLDAYLTGPEGQRVELFTEVGGSGDHFEKTIFDDQASNTISKAKPPFADRFRPEAIDKKQPGLGGFNGQSVKGVWQLVIRGTRSDRFGMLHSWGLTVKPVEDDKMADSSTTTSTMQETPTSTDAAEPGLMDAETTGVAKEKKANKKDDPARIEKRLEKKADKENRKAKKGEAEGGSSLFDLFKKSPF